MSYRMYAPTGKGSVDANNSTIAVPAVQDFCDRAYDYLVSIDEQDGMVKWDVPHQSGMYIRGQGFVPDGLGWFMNIDERFFVENAPFTAAELALVDPAIPHGGD